MDIYETITLRKSVRSYKSDPIPTSVLQKILKTAEVAPSAMNLQPWRFIIIQDEALKRQLAKSSRFARFLKDTPLVIVACGDTRSRFYIQDTSIALEHIVLAATAEGLGTCWIGDFKDAILCPLLNIPTQYRIVALLALGYPRNTNSLTRRILKGIRKTRKVSEIAYRDSFGTPFFEEQIDK